MKRSSGQFRVPTLTNQVVYSPPKPVKRFFEAILSRVGDLQTEASAAVQRKPEEACSTIWVWLPLLSLTNALGVALIAYAFSNSRDGGVGLRFFLYPGLLLIFTPVALRLIAPTASRMERIWLLCITGICCFCIKVESSPLYFSLYDEFLHLRTADDITRSGHLFTANALLPVGPYYPGLEIVTNALSSLTNFNTFYSGLIVVGVARLLMILTLFALNELIFQSSRTASIATILYMANPHFFFFDAQFAYESLALPLMVFIMFVMIPYESLSARLIYLETAPPSVMFTASDGMRDKKELFSITIIASIVLVALVVTHHVTDVFLDGVLLLWAIVHGALRNTPLYRSSLTWTAFLGVLLTLVWISFKGNPVLSYLSSFLGTVQKAPQQYPVISSNPAPLLPERGVSALAVVLILTGLSLGLFCLWHHYRYNRFIYTLGVISLLYPISQVFSLTITGSQIKDRATALLFISVASVIAIFIARFWPKSRLNWRNSSLIACAMSVIFIGGFISSGGSGFGSLPGPYEVAADARSISPEGIQAAQWTYSYLGPNNRIATDRTNQILMGTYGDQRLVTPLADQIDVSPIFIFSRLDPYELAILRNAQVRYLVVDLRLARALPIVGFYFSKTEFGAYMRTTPIPLGSLTKFNTLPQMEKVFDSGDVVIYYVKGLGNAP